MLQRCGPLAALVLAIVCAGGDDVRAQENPVSWSAKVTARDMRPGASFDVTVIGVAEEEWHVYSVTQGPGGRSIGEIAPTQRYTCSSSAVAQMPSKGHFGSPKVNTKHAST